MTTTTLFRCTGLALLLAAGARAEHWAFRAPVDRPAPEATDPAWNGNVVDRWIKARLDREGLAPAPEADRATLLRRASFALTGLPPTPAELDAFLADTAPGAWERQVDRLLASPRHGERAARLWLDSARYADSNGQDENMAMAHAWRYRDWVVNAFNRDLPFAEFVTRQLAGDLAGATLTDAGRADALTATGFLVLGPKQLAEQDKDKLLLDVADEQLDTVGRAFLGIGLGCARCHDHKTDPVSARDYHALAGIFRGTRTMLDTGFVSKWHERDASTPAQRAAAEAHRAAVAAAAAARNQRRDEANAELRARLRAAAPRLLLGEAGADLPDFAVKRWAEALNRPGLAGWRAVRDAASVPAAWRADPVLSRVRAEPPADRAEAAAWLGAELARLSEGKGPARVPGRRGGAWAESAGPPVDVPHRPELEPATWTLEAWVRLDRIPAGKEDNRRWIVNKNGNEWVRGHIALGIEGRRAIAYLAPEGGRERQSRAESEVVLEKNEWTQLAATFDGSFLRLFVNGEPQGQARVEQPRRAGDGHLRIGGRADGYNGFPEGRIDDVRLFARALDPAEIQRRFREPDAFAPDGLVQAWTFDPADAREERDLALGELAALARGPQGLFAPPEKPEPHWSGSARDAHAAAAARVRELEERAPVTPMVLAVEDGPRVNLRVFQRGDHLNPVGDPVPRGLPAALGGDALPPPAVAASSGGRAELAAWIADPRHPLAPRVMVNRLWQADFGAGLVRTPDDFGRTGEPPDHPELLDALALEFTRGGGSFKRLHRLLLTSRAWRSAAGGAEALRARDPDNRLFGRAHRRRLEAEMIRDAVLQVSGRLDPAPGGSLVDFANREYVPGDPDTGVMRRRALYLPVLRDRMPAEFAFFDAPQPSACTGRREASVVALQALYFLNGPLPREAAEALGRSLAAGTGDETARIAHAFRLLYARVPTPAETARVTAFLRACPPETAWTETILALLAANEFLHLD